MRILSLAALRGPDVETLHALGEVELDPWNNYVPIKLPGADDLIARTAGVDVLIVEADPVPARLFAERPQGRIVAACRADPVHVDVDPAARARRPRRPRPGANAHAGPRPTR